MQQDSPVETNFYYCKTRYYSPAWCRFISSDSINYLETENINGLNLYMYCNNNPIMYADLNGHAPKWLKNVLDIGLYVASAVVSIVVGIAVSSVINPVAGITAGIAIFSALNNATNAIYYNCISDGVNDEGVTSSSYTENGYINRWDRLDYTKDQTKEDNYNINAWRYFSEYNLHM